MKTRSVAPAPAVASDALRLSQQVLRHLPSGIVFFDADGRVEDANPAACAALGYKRPRGMSLDALFRNATLHDSGGEFLGEAPTVIAQVVSGSHILQRKTMRYTAPDGQTRHLGLTSFPVRDGDPDSPPGLICLLTDLTAIRALEDELQRRRSMSALGEMAAGIAHEFKNALATISGYAQMLSSRLDGTAREQACKILLQAAMLNNVATEFLAFARPLVLQPVRVELGPLLHECAESIQVQDFPTVRIVLEGPFPTVAGEAGLLSAVAMNLLRNACEAISAGGRGGRVLVRFAGMDGTKARLQFIDDGPGMPPDVVEKAFIPFFTTKPSGSGLGLAMVHKIVAAHQGSVQVSASSPGCTMFTLLLPTPKIP